MLNRTYFHRIITLPALVYLPNADLIDIVSDSVGIPDIKRICDNWVSKLEET